MASLVPDYSSDSESSTVDSDSGEVDEKPVLQPLPRPDFNAVYPEGQSVFLNPFKAADNAKLAILEKHVKMISTDVQYVNGKKVCWNSKKNKCPYGQRCKYAHVSDLQVNESSKKSETSSKDKGDKMSPNPRKQMYLNKSKKRVNTAADTNIVKNKKARKTK